MPRPPWSTEKEPGRARLTREVLTRAAMKIVDAEGLEELTMRRLAEEIGTVPSAIYAHVSGRPELLQMLIDEAAKAIVVPAPDPKRWQEQVREVMRSMRASLAAHRDLASANLGSIPTGHTALKVVDGLLAILLAGKLPKQVAAYAADVLPMYVSASVYEGSLFAQRMEKDPQFWQRLGTYMRAVPRDQYPTASGLVDELLAPDAGPDARFEFGLALLVNGLGTMARKK